MRHLRTISIAAAFGMVFTLAPLTGHEQQAQATTPDPCATVHQPLTAPKLISEGDFKDSYEIASANDLVYLSENLDQFVSGTSGPQWREKDFVQTAPIDLDGCDFTPISNPTEESSRSLFTGSYDGQFAPIYGLVVDTNRRGGLFGETNSGARLERIVLSGVSIRGGAGSGALVGYATGTTIRESSATGTVTGTSNIVGGLAGEVVGNSTISASFANVAVTANSGVAHGGLVGVLTASSVTDSYARGSVTGQSRAGGLIGEISESNINISRSFAANSTTGNSSVGGLVGSSNFASNPTVTHSFWDTEATDPPLTASAGGTGKTTAEMRQFATFNAAEWPVVNGWEAYDPANGKVWGIREGINDDYPFLLWQYKPFNDTFGFFCGPLSDDGYHLISNPQELASVGAGGANSPCGLGDNYRQTADIDLSAVSDWTPIGDDDNRFTGVFDGQGFTISGLTITTAANDLGLFGVVGAGGKVENVTMTGINISFTGTGQSDIGGLAGSNYGIVRNSNTAGVIDTPQANVVGGLVGRADRSEITRSFSNVTVTGNQVVGGLTGSLSGSGATISDSHATGPVTSTESTQAGIAGGLIGEVLSASVIRSFATGNVTALQPWAGGLVGHLDGKATVEDSYATGDVQSNESVGGLIGLLNNSEAKRSYSTGKVTGTDDTGGLIGKATGERDISASFWDTTTSETQDSAGGTGLETDLMKTISPFTAANWSIGSCTTAGQSTVWGIDATVNSGYPFLVWAEPDALNACPTPTDPTPSPETNNANTNTTTSPLPSTPDTTNDMLIPLAPLGQTSSGGPLTVDTEQNVDEVTQEEDTTTPDTTDTAEVAEISGGESVGDASVLDTTTGLATGWLWALGLGSLGVAGLIAGGVAIARMRA